MTTASKVKKRFSGGGLDLSGIDRWLGRLQAFNLDARVDLYRRLAAFAKRGKSPDVPLRGMWMRSEKKKQSKRVVYHEILMGLTNGRSITQVFKPFIPAGELQLIRAGDESAVLEDGFERAAFVAVSLRRMKNAVIEALLYPAGLLIMLAFMLDIASNNLLPPMEGLMDPSEWPRQSAAFRGLALFVRDWGLVCLVAFSSFMLLCFSSMPRWSGGIRSLADRFMPLFIVYRIYQGSAFLITLGALVKAGTPVRDAIASVYHTANKYMQRHLDKMLSGLDRGFEPGRALNTGLLPNRLMELVEDYSQAGALHDALTGLGEETIEESIRSITRVANLIRYLLMIALAGTILIVVGGMYALVFKVYQTARGAYQG